MSLIEDISKYLPTVQKPTLKLNFMEKAKWTMLILVIFFVLGSITVWGVNQSAVAQFTFLEIVFGSRFGSLITLGIGPIVTSSIILQLLVGSKIINWDLTDERHKKLFNSSQKILAIVFSFIEAFAFVLAGAVPPASSDLFVVSMVIAQLAIGGIIIILMDEVVSKWGFGSGVSLFIAAGVSKTIFVRIFSPPIQGTTGGIFASAISALSQGRLDVAIISFLPLIATAVVFALVVYAQAIRVEIPMSFAMPFGKLASRRWPLKFIYTSNIPVILTAAVIANLQVMGRLLFSKGINLLGTYDSSGRALTGLALFVSTPSSSGDPASALAISVTSILAGIFALGFALLALRIWKRYALRSSVLGGMFGALLGVLILYVYNLPMLNVTNLLHVIVYMLIFVVGSVIFSIFWVSTSGMDSRSLAEQFKAASIVIPGFRHDPRIVEKVLDRYIPALTVMGGAFVGFLAAFADLTNAIGTGTGLLLTVMIVYQLYEQITSQHSDDIPQPLRKFMGV